MKIFVDIGHPAHFHYLKNFIKIMQSRGHSFVITARDKEVTFRLLESMGLEFYNRGKGARGMLNNLCYLVKTDWEMFKIARKHKPDIFFSPASAYIAQVSKLLKKPYIGFDDTEHASLNQKLYLPFSDVILTPACFNKSLGKKQIRFDSYLELSYLYPKYFKPDLNFKQNFGFQKDEKLTIVRFIAWEAFHDKDKSGPSIEFKMRLIKEVAKHSKVIISSEKKLPDQLKEFEFNLPPDQLHNLINACDLYIGEGGTTANECACLGVPNILINSLLNPKTIPGVHMELEKRGLQILYEKADDSIIEIACKILNNNEFKSTFISNRNKMLNEKIDLTSFWVWFIENFPESKKEMMNNPDYQFIFRNN